MKLRFFFAVAICFFFRTSGAQDVPPYMLNDAKAITIDSSLIQLLAKEKWFLDVATEYIHNRLDTLKDSKMEMDLGVAYLFGVAEKEKVYGSNGWCVIAKKAIWLSYDTSKANNKPLINGVVRPSGSFIIYEISDTSLVLCRTLTSNASWKKYYRFVRGAAMENAVKRKSALSKPQYSYNESGNILDLDSISKIYPEGLTKNTITAQNKTTYQYIIVKNKKAIVYEKMVFNSGVDAYYKNNVFISQEEFEKALKEYGEK